MLRPSKGPRAGSTVESEVTMTPHMVIDWPHHLLSAWRVRSVSVCSGCRWPCWSCSFRLRGDVGAASERSMAWASARVSVDAGEPAFAEAPEVGERAVALAADVGVGGQRLARRGGAPLPPASGGRSRRRPRQPTACCSMRAAPATPWLTAASKWKKRERRRQLRAGGRPASSGRGRCGEPWRAGWPSARPSWRRSCRR